jgi:branched-chain amino acid aminotransferase
MDKEKQSVTEFMETASVDGVVAPLAEARVPVMDRGFLYGDSIYEVFRTYSGVPLFFDEHWARFENSARLIGMDIGFSREHVRAEIRAAVAASGAPEAGRDVYVRYVVTRGAGPLDLLPASQARNRLVVIVKAVPEWRDTLYSHGIRLAVVRVRRNPSAALDPNIKGGNYLNNVLGVMEASRHGADDCLMLSETGLVTEASNSNVFVLLNGALVTPSQVAANLKGLTKAAIHEACHDDGLETAETEITGDDLARATECFLSSATREVMPVASVRLEDGTVHRFPEGGGPVTTRVAALYKAHIADYVASHERLSLF